MTRTMDSRKRWLALVVLCLGDLMIVLDSTIVNVALPSIRADLGFSETALVWVVNAYLLTFGGFLLLGGRLGDLFGHRRLFLLGRGLLHPCLACLRPCQFAGAPCHGAGRAGDRRRRRLGGRPLADHEPLHRGSRAREGDGRLRLRHGRRRSDRRAARRPADRHARLALDLPGQSADRRRGHRAQPPPAAGGSRAGRAGNASISPGR